MGKTWSRREVAHHWTVARGHTVRRAAWLLLGLLDDRALDAFVGSQAPDGLDKERLLEVSWSSTQELVARAGEALYSGRGRLDFGRAASYFDARQYRALKRALEVRFEDADWGEPAAREVECPGTTADVTIERVKLAHVHAAADLYFRVQLSCGSQTTLRFPGFDGRTPLPPNLLEAVADAHACENDKCLHALGRLQAVAGEEPTVAYDWMRARGEAGQFLQELRCGTSLEQRIASRLNDRG